MASHNEDGEELIDFILCPGGGALTSQRSFDRFGEAGETRLIVGTWTLESTTAKVQWKRWVDWSRPRDPSANDRRLDDSERDELQLTLSNPLGVDFYEDTISRLEGPCVDPTSAEGPKIGPTAFTASRVIEDADLAGKSADQLRAMLEELEARRGATFEEPDGKTLRGQTWYRPLVSREQARALMSPVERVNLDLLQAALDVSDPVERELVAVLLGVARAQAALADTRYLSAPPTPRPVAALSEEAVPWGATPDWTQLGYDPLRPVRGVYWITVDPGGKDYVAHGEAMGAHGPVEYTVTQSRPPMRVP